MELTMSDVTVGQHYVRMLRRVLRLRRKHQHELNEFGLQLFDRVIFALYRECSSANALDEAKAALAEHRLMSKLGT